jgi:hypothetical protein
MRSRRGTVCIARVTEPTTPNTAPASDAALPPRVGYRHERRAVGAVFFLVTGVLIVNGAAVIHRDTYRPAAPSAFAACSDGIAALTHEFDARLAEVRATAREPLRRSLESGADPAGRARAALVDSDERLYALRPVCAREGPDAARAYDSLVLWRYQAEDLANVTARILLPDAERALRYRSPQASSTP